MKKMLLYILAVSSPLFLITAFNLYIDSNCEINDTYAEEIADQLMDHPLSIYENIPERVVMRKRIENNSGKHFNKVVIGSSRILLIGKNIGEKVFNVSVGGAVLEDLEIISREMRENNLTFDTIIVGGDPWLMLPEHGNEEYKTFYPGVDGSSISSMLSWEYFYKNLTFKKIKNWDGNDEDLVFFQDGSIRYNKKYRLNTTVSPQTLNIDEMVYIGNFSHIDTTYYARLKEFLKTLALGNTIIEIILVPYHPIVYEFINEKHSKLNEIEAGFYAFKSDRVNVFGAYNPELLGFDSTSFYDPIHLNEESIKLLYSKRKSL